MTIALCKNVKYIHVKSQVTGLCIMYLDLFVYKIPSKDLVDKM